MPEYLTESLKLRVEAADGGVRALWRVHLVAQDTWRHQSEEPGAASRRSPWSVRTMPIRLRCMPPTACGTSGGRAGTATRPERPAEAAGVGDGLPRDQASPR